MAKGKRQKSKSSGNSQNVSLQQSPIPKINVVPVIDTTEEGEKILKSSIATMEEYVNGERQKADQYYEDIKNKANEILKNADDYVAKAEEKAVEKIKHDMEQRINEANEEAERIISEAKESAAEIKNQELIKSEELERKLKEVLQQKIDLDNEKENYKQKELQEFIAKLKEFEDELKSKEQKLKKQAGDIKALEDDVEYYTKEIEENIIRKNDILKCEYRVKELESTYSTINNLYNEKVNEIESLKKQIISYGENPAKAIEKNEEYEKQISDLKTRLLDCPSEEEIKDLREKADKYVVTCNQLEKERERCCELSNENNELKLQKDEIENYRRFIKLLELQQAELKQELDRNIQLYNNSSEKVFANLSKIDDEKVNIYPSIFSNNFKEFPNNLKDLCNNFKGYLENRDRNPLYYDMKTIRTFIAGFASSRIMILEGLSGTGKSSLPRAFKDFIGAHVIEVPVQSSWKDRNDLLGFYNDFKKQYKETDFLKALYQATHDPNNIYIIVLDEMNLSRIEYYFADFLSVLENPNSEEWKVELISDYASINQNSAAWPKLIHEGKLQIIDNTWFVGTANKDDSTFTITDKVYDRAVVINFEKKGEKDNFPKQKNIQINNTDFLKLLEKNKFDAKSKDRFNKMMNFLDDYVKDHFQITFGNRIANQLEKFVPAYIACGGNVDEAVDIMFARKVLRKLEGLYDEDTKNNLESFKNSINENEYDMPITIKSIEKMIKKI